MCVDMCVDTCVDMCTDMRTDVCHRHVPRHVRAWTRAQMCAQTCVWTCVAAPPAGREVARLHHRQPLAFMRAGVGAGRGAPDFAEQVEARFFIARFFYWTVSPTADAEDQRPRGYKKRGRGVKKKEGEGSSRPHRCCHPNPPSARAEKSRQK